MPSPFPTAYVDDRLGFTRRPSRAVMVGSVQVGGGAPLVVQSMCTTPTQDVTATIEQSIVLAEAGCQVVRITAPGVKDAQALKVIRSGFTAAGFAHIPLVADIHFMPNAALEAVEHVEKVRINPGNYADKKRFAVKEYTDADYAEELDKVADRFRPLVRRAKTLGRALRIGTNHGSLSDRIMNRFGDTPAGMVESAMEFIRIAESEGFKDLIISMKASNPKIMVAAYRLLVATLRDHGEQYPLHLGVTEAGDGEDGRIKSAAGIGALLEDGLGDTIRVSLTEPPECEIPVARQLAAFYDGRAAFSAPISAPPERVTPFSFTRRVAAIVRVAGDIPIGGGQIPAVLVPPAAPGAPGREPAADAVVGDDLLWVGMPRAIPGSESGAPDSMHRAAGTVPLLRLHAGEDASRAPAGSLVLVRLDHPEPAPALARTIATLREDCLVGIAEAGLLGELRAYRLLAATIEAAFANDERTTVGSGRRQPIAIALPFIADDLQIAAVAGGLLVDGIGDALYLPAAANPRRLAFTLLQAVKARVTRADYVACPSCGRTQFDLMEVTASIKTVTDHLDGVTIAIMGCIVNGPGEMADADFGYVGSGPGKIDLYRGKTVVRRNLPFDQARGELIALIKEAGMWKEPEG